MIDNWMIDLIDQWIDWLVFISSQAQRMLWDQGVQLLLLLQKNAAKKGIWKRWLGLKILLLKR